ncbi:CaiB/BaiF CoA-transferase family protein [Shewanella amazonensis]|uniref:Acyl-CoA transferase/carnitine dehydratase n=1 Tax=Shewanella amazonensis (strain ATCC BAA-1098 / SB2B) TaxID=326297 RepID=A1SAU6_SHEAM|nr:CaiB/BaiF CoA-transferase family protein [Shewanella amazonensis]ABM01503.1 acyl-CoA transferase/carnitine dehydratase [Shewanella amazonensis SB2B]
MKQPLKGLRVLDLSRVLAGPWCSQLLADMGAEVIKIEHPDGGDDTRHWGPPYAGGHTQGDAAYFLAANRGKKSLLLDLKNPHDVAQIQKLARHSDILLENFKVGGLAKYGLDYGSLKAMNPQLVYCSITGFGQSGPDAPRAGYDFMIQAMGGLMSLTGAADDGGEPMKTGVAITDLFTGLYAANAILAAIVARQSTGLGCHIDMALFDVQLAMLANQAQNFLASGQNPPRLGNAHPNIVPYQAFACADGHLILAVGNDGQFARFCELAGLHELPHDSRFATNAGRVRHRETLLPLIKAAMLTKSKGEWLALLNDAGVPAGPINTVSEALDEPQAQHRQMQIERDFNGERLPFVGSPVKMDGEALNSPLPPPRLGEHQQELLAWLDGLES